MAATQMGPAQERFDVLIIGSGAAGLTAALHLAPFRRVAIISKGPVDEGSTRYAQGGISAVLDKTDSFDSHVSDTLDAGAGLCEIEAVRRTVAAGPEAIKWLMGLGVPFTREAHEGRSRLHLTREGGHSARRVAHAADATGQAIEEALVETARGQPRIEVFERHLAVDVIVHEINGKSRVIGAYVQDGETRKVQT
ncbi:MAG: FAD-dependent oxidoreductase, partial [Thioalkalivibrio sp.]|nr:FAD-dependent oxidoreductase [Thioalkalivibrio sp.]